MEHDEIEERREGVVHGLGTDFNAMTCPYCGSTDISTKTRTAEEPSGRVLDGETACKCNDCEEEWTEL